ncbi:MAG: glucosylceramidase [Butyrivibrio sp.]|nr:glucosylceramidase [Butyrivibrio sp.]
MNNIRKIETDFDSGLFWHESTLDNAGAAGEMKLLVVYPKETETEIRGFGGAFTEAAAHTYAGLDEGEKDKLIKALFGPDGLRYNIGRIHMNSCDFALGNYTYIDEGDESLSSFSIEHDEKEIIPMIRDAEKELGRQPVLIMAPWSPPPFMKTNGEMNHGGNLKEEYADLWAKYFVRFIREYEKRGIDISFTTVQNEPNAVQTWDSCNYTTEQEADFVINHLGPELKREGLLGKVKIFVWDHNKEEAYNRFSRILEAKGADEYVSGCAVHWYSGDHFDTLRLIRKNYPDKEIFFTEGCVEYSILSGAGDVHFAEMYAHQMIGNLKGGCSAIFDWNLLVDHKGGPNHVGNFCDAPIKALEDGKTFEKKLSYYYIGHLSRYVKEGAKLIWSSCYDSDLDTAAFVNPDGERVIVVLNRTGREIPLVVKEEDSSVKLSIKPHSIQTMLYTL